MLEIRGGKRLAKHNYARCQPWAVLALERDNYQCKMCDSDTLHVVVHHLDESRKLGRKKMNNELYNLITLCRNCHKSIHGFLVKHKFYPMPLKSYRQLQKEDRKSDPRINIIKELRQQDKSFSYIAEYLGLSRQRVHQLYSGV